MMRTPSACAAFIPAPASGFGHWRRFASALILSWAAVFTGPEARSEPELLNAIIARVNDSVITLKDIRGRMAPDLEFLIRQYATQPEVFEQKRRELQQKYVEQLVEIQLILHEFKTAGYKLPDTYINEEIDKDIKTTYGDRATLTKTLQAQGRTYESYRTELREAFIIRAMYQHNVPREPTISPHKIELYYVQNRDKFKVEDQVKLRMIVIANRPNDSQFSAKKLAQEILTKIKDGTPFAEMARVYSGGSQSSEGGDWNWIERSVLRPDLAEKAFAMKAGELSDVIDAPDGCYLMLVEQTRPAHIKPLPEVRDEIEATLKAEESKRLRKKWIDRLKIKSFVRYY